MSETPHASCNTPTAAITHWQLDAVGLRRGRTQVFEGLTLQLRERRIALIGSNGAGKSSLLRLLCALELPSSGRLLRDGCECPSAPDGAVGLMFQNADDQIIFPSVAEELAFSWRSAQPPATLQALGTRAVRRAADEAARAFLHDRGLAAWADRAVGSLSQGQRQMLCWLAMQLAAPRVLLLDEPFASLDLAAQIQMAAQMEDVEQQIIVSTHILEWVRDWERVIWLREGTIAADGSGQSVCQAYENWVRSSVLAVRHF